MAYMEDAERGQHGDGVEADKLPLATKSAVSHFRRVISRPCLEPLGVP